MWLEENRIVAVGHDANPTLFVNSGGQWKFDRQLDKKAAAGLFLWSFHHLRSHLQRAPLVDFLLATCGRTALPKVPMMLAPPLQPWIPATKIASGSSLLPLFVSVGSLSHYPSQIHAINANMFSTVGLDGNLGVWPHSAVQL